MKTRIISMLMAFLMLFAITQAIGAEDSYDRPVVGVAWRSDQEAESFVAVCKAIEAAGGRPVVLGQVLSADLAFENNRLVGSTDADGVLTAEAVRLITLQYLAGLQCGRSDGRYYGGCVSGRGRHLPFPVL